MIISRLSAGSFPAVSGNAWVDLEANLFSLSGIQNCRSHEDWTEGCQRASRRFSFFPGQDSIKLRPCPIRKLRG